MSATVLPLAMDDAEKSRVTSVCMTTSFDSVAKLSEQELLDHFADLVVRDRRTTAELLVAIAEIDERKLWAVHACSSMFTFCMERYHMSEQVTAKRLWAARTARRFPLILEMVARGDLHLAAIHLLAKHLTDENHARVLERAKHKSSRDVERLVAELAPQADVPSRIRALPGARGAGSAAVDGPALAATAVPDGISGDGASGDVALMDEASSRADSANADPTGRECDARNLRTAESRPAAKPIVALSPRRYKIEITVDEATHDKLRSLQDLLARSGTGREPAAIISRAIDELLVRTLARKAALTDRPRSTSPAKTARTSNPAKPEPADLRSPPKPGSEIPVVSRGQRNRSIPAAVRREVWRRDSGRCCHADERGRRCRETGNVEFHHKIPFAHGGPSTPENIELRCAAHNQFQADLDFGRPFMDARRRLVAASRAFPGECWR